MGVPERYLVVAEHWREDRTYYRDDGGKAARPGIYMSREGPTHNEHLIVSQ